MVLQVPPNPGQRVAQGHAGFLHYVARADAGELKNLRRADRPGRQNQFAARLEQGLLRPPLDRKGQPAGP